MFDTPYQTTPCSRFVLDKIATGIRRLEIDDLLVKVAGVEGIALVPPGVTEFPPFLQAITNKEIPTLANTVVLDGRSLLRPDGTAVRIDVFQHAVLTAKLTKLWVQGDASVRHDFLNVGDFALKSFTSWVCSALALRLGLDFSQTTMLRALTTIYFLQLHEVVSSHTTPLEQDRIMVRAARALVGMDPITLNAAVGQIPPLKDIKDYVAWVKKVLNTPRVEDLTVGFIYIALGASYGPAYREAVAVALEYPPTFIAMVYTAVNDRGYSKTGLGKVVERVISRDNHKEFIKNVNNLTKG